MGDALWEKPFLGCSHCHLHETCPLAEQDGASPPDLGPDSRGAGLVVSTSLVFLLPLATGITGAALAPRWLSAAASQEVSGYQGLGLIAGLAVGVVLAKIVLVLRQRRQPCPVGENE